MNAHDRSLYAAPANIEAEQALLGAILVNNAAMDRVGDLLEVQHFHEPLHRKIFEVIAKSLAAGRSVNPITIKGYLPEEVPDLKVDGERATVMQYLAKLAAEAVTIVHARNYAEGIHEMWIRRQAISVAQEVVDIAFELEADRDILDEFEPIESKITALRAERIRGANRIGIGQRYLESMNEACKRGSVRGVPLCLGEIATVISEPCFEAGNLYGLLSSSGEGKTSLTLQIISYALEKGHPVQFQSYDQSAEQCIRQMVAQKYGIEARRQRSGALGEKEWDTAVEYARWIDRQPFEVVKCTDQNAGQLVGYAKTFVKRHANGAVPLIVTDHIGSIKPEDRKADEGTKAKEINKILKAGAEIVDGAWLVLNQRNSFGMRRDNPRPISADLFGGDPAKQAYDAIMYLYRPEKFKAEREATAATDADWKKINRVFSGELEGVAEIGAIKVRFGNPNVRERLRFEDRFTRYQSERPAVDQSKLEGF